MGKEKINHTLDLDLLEKQLLKKPTNKARRLNRLRAGLLQFFMTIVALLFAIPIFIVINYSFKTTKELFLSSPLQLPQSFNLANYQNAFRRLQLGTTFTNTLFYTVISVLALSILCGAAAWAISRNKSKIYKFFYVYFLLGIFIPYQALFLSIYIVGFKAGLVNTRLGLILMYIATGMSFGVFLMTSFMSTVPLELEDAAKIDGCSVYKTYFLIVLPLLKPAIATLTILQAFQIWNDFLMASLFISKQELRTITLAMQLLFSQQASDYTTAMAGIIVSVLPVAVLFISLQKYFVQGMTAGALKG
ncbi:MAG: carbohydrate ABC transporter permease [Firmicutes bacterium]|nr:carbohydrate ABC transporter permease [Bacillota bacterium]